MKTFDVSLFVFILTLAFVSPQGSGFAQGGDERTQRTAHYRITLEIGPVATMPRPDQVSSATDGEVPLAMPGTPMATMAMTDQGRPVNRHIEVTVYDKTMGARRRSAMPRITITDRKTGSATALQAVTATHDVTEGEGDVHFGEDVHLANGCIRGSRREVKQGARRARACRWPGCSTLPDSWR